MPRLGPVFASRPIGQVVWLDQVVGQCQLQLIFPKVPRSVLTVQPPLFLERSPRCITNKAGVLIVRN